MISNDGCFAIWREPTNDVALFAVAIELDKRKIIQNSASLIFYYPLLTYIQHIILKN